MALATLAALDKQVGDTIDALPALASGGVAVDDRRIGRTVHDRGRGPDQRQRPHRGPWQRHAVDRERAGRGSILGHPGGGRAHRPHRDAHRDRHQAAGSVRTDHRAQPAVRCHQPDGHLEHAMGHCAAGRGTGRRRAGACADSLVRRSDGTIGVLRSLGFTRGQVARALCWRASLLATMAVVVGVPVGVVAGRWGWPPWPTASVSDPPVVHMWAPAFAAVTLVVIANVSRSALDRAPCRHRVAESLSAE